MLIIARIVIEMIAPVRLAADSKLDDAEVVPPHLKCRPPQAETPRFGDGCSADDAEVIPPH